LPGVGRATTTLHPPAGVVAVSATAHHAELIADPAASPHWNLGQHRDADAIDQLDPKTFGPDAHDYAWAWVDEAAGQVRARSFALGKGIVEDEATGSAALVLCGHLGRPITIRQGRGSLISAEPRGGGLVAVRGRVTHDERIVVDGECGQLE